MTAISGTGPKLPPIIDPSPKVRLKDKLDPQPPTPGVRPPRTKCPDHPNGDGHRPTQAKDAEKLAHVLESMRGAKVLANGMKEYLAIKHQMPAGPTSALPERPGGVEQMQEAIEALLEHVDRIDPAPRF